MNLQRKLFPELSPNQQISLSTSSGAVMTNTLPPGAKKITGAKKVPGAKKIPGAQKLSGAKK